MDISGVKQMAMDHSERSLTGRDNPYYKAKAAGIMPFTGYLKLPLFFWGSYVSDILG